MGNSNVTGSSNSNQNQSKNSQSPKIQRSYSVGSTYDNTQRRESKVLNSGRHYSYNSGPRDSSQGSRIYRSQSHSSSLNQNEKTRSFLDISNIDDSMASPQFESLENKNQRDLNNEYIFNRIFDPIVNSRTPFHNPRENLTSTHNMVVPFNTMPSLTPIKVLDCLRLSQTDAKSVINEKYTKDLISNNPSSLAQLVANLHRRMGVIYDDQKNLGTCICIANNLIITARHVIEGKKITELSVSFGFIDYIQEIQSISFVGVVEDNPQYDYAIILLAGDSNQSCISLQKESDPSLEVVLLHHPEGRVLNVSVHACDQHNYQSDHLTIFHDSEHVSSGGGYFNPSEQLVAIHLGAGFENDEYHPRKYAITINAILEKNPESILASLNKSKFFPQNQPKILLKPIQRKFIIEEEGYESKKIFNSEFKNIQGITKNLSGISFDSENLAGIQKNHKAIFDKCINQCLYINGIHAETKKYSVVGHIESDHTIPYDVWKKSKLNPNMQKFIKGKGKRPGENSLPAITIPYNNHKNLLTTGRATEVQKFHSELVTKCNQKKIDQALIDCFNEYSRNNIKVDFSIVSKSLKLHKDLKVINSQDEKNVLLDLKLIKKGRS